MNIDERLKRESCEVSAEVGDPNIEPLVARLSSETHACLWFVRE